MLKFIVLFDSKYGQMKDKYFKFPNKRNLKTVVRIDSVC